MRVISQDGMMDIQYENFSLGITGGNHITAIRDIVASPRVIADGILAKYSSKEKALKAMEMLRTTYLSRMELDGGYDRVNGCYVHPNYWVLPKVFQFPADDEVKV